MIKQVIPMGWSVSPIREQLCKEAGIGYTVIVTGWDWRNRHANPIKTVIIKDCDLAKAELIHKYYARIKVKG